MFVTELTIDLNRFIVINHFLNIHFANTCNSASHTLFGTTAKIFYWDLFCITGEPLAYMLYCSAEGRAGDWLE